MFKTVASVAVFYGGIAQLARAFGSYPECHWFKSSYRYQKGLFFGLFFCVLQTSCVTIERDKDIRTHLSSKVTFWLNWATGSSTGKERDVFAGNKNISF